MEVILVGFSNPTEEEILLKKELEKRDIKVITQPYDGHKHPDLGIPQAMVNIEVDGIHHLTDPEQIVRDLSRSHYSNEKGYATIHIQNETIRMHLIEIADAIAEAAKITEKRFKEGREKKIKEGKLEIHSS